MNFDFLRKPSEVVDVSVDGEIIRPEKKRKWVVLIIVVAIIFLMFGNFGDGEKTELKSNETIKKGSFDDYAEKTEKKLQDMISTVKGAGKVNVMVVFENMGERVPAVNIKSQNETEAEGEKKLHKSSEEENVILFGSASEEGPYVLKERVPTPVGVFVTATGASDERVKLEIYEAVKALYGISGHRVKVSSAKNS